MKILTSYFGNLKKVKNPIAICASVPIWYTRYIYRVLAPSYELLMGYKNGNITPEQYTIEYNAYLATLDAHNVVRDLKAMEPNCDEITLLCYEKRGEFCHRHLVAEWLKSNGYEVSEC